MVKITNDTYVHARAMMVAMITSQVAVHLLKLLCVCACVCVCFATIDGLLINVGTSC